MISLKHVSGCVHPNNVLNSFIWRYWHGLLYFIYGWFQFCFSPLLHITYS